MDLFKVLFITLALALTGCSKDLSKEMNHQSADALWKMRQASMTDAEKMNTLRVVDMTGQAVAGAQVLIGNALNEPFAANFVTTTKDGSFQAPAEWADAETVTIGASGYVRASYVGQLPAGQTFVLRPSAKEKKYELKGQGTGFKVVDKDDKIDFALFLPVLKKNDLFAFDMNKVISPQMDEIVVYGQKMQMPSNISLPKQKENYGIFPVTMEKPIFRVYLEDLGPTKIIAARGQFPFNKIVKEMQNKKSFFELINYFSIQGGSLKTVNITGATQTVDLPVNELSFTLPKSFKAPVFSNDQNLLAIPLAVYDGEYFPTDLKNVASNTSMNLMTPTGLAPLLVTVLTTKPGSDNKMDGRLSVNIGEFQAGVAPQMLDLLPIPEVVNVASVKVKPVVQPAYLNSVGTYSLLSVLETQTIGGNKVEVANRIWEVYGQGWMSEVSLPVWPNDGELKGKKRWEVSLIGSPDKGIDLGPVMLENASHATRAQADF